MSKKEDVVIRGIVGTLIDGTFHPDAFTRSQIDGTYRTVTLQLSGFKQPDKNRIIDPMGDEMDMDGRVSFKAINPEFLLKFKE